MNSESGAVISSFDSSISTSIELGLKSIPMLNAAIADYQSWRADKTRSPFLMQASTPNGSPITDTESTLHPGG